LGVVACLALAACGDDAKDKVEEITGETAFEVQAARGQILFGRHCAECHGDSGQGGIAPRLVGLDQGALPLDPPPTRQVRTTQFVTVGDVAAFAVANMPPGQGGSLSNSEYLAILAFDLKANGIELDEELTLEIAEGLTIPR
jgi:cytochrome c